MSKVQESRSYEIDFSKSRMSDTSIQRIQFMQSLVVMGRIVTGIQNLSIKYQNDLSGYARSHMSAGNPQIEFGTYVREYFDSGTGAGPLPQDYISVGLGLTYHELGHVLYSSSLSSAITSAKYKVGHSQSKKIDAAWNMLEDQRIEKVLSERYAYTTQFLRYITGKFINSGSSLTNAYLIIARNHIPLHMKKAAFSKLTRSDKSTLEKMLLLTAKWNQATQPIKVKTGVNPAAVKYEYTLAMSKREGDCASILVEFSKLLPSDGLSNGCKDGHDSNDLSPELNKHISKEDNPTHDPNVSVEEYDHNGGVDLSSEVENMEELVKELKVSTGPTGSKKGQLKDATISSQSMLREFCKAIKEEHQSDTEVQETIQSIEISLPQIEVNESDILNNSSVYGEITVDHVMADELRSVFSEVMGDSDPSYVPASSGRLNIGRIATTDPDYSTVYDHWETNVERDTEFHMNVIFDVSGSMSTTQKGAYNTSQVMKELYPLGYAIDTSGSGASISVFTFSNETRLLKSNEDLWIEPTYSVPKAYGTTAIQTSAPVVELVSKKFVEKGKRVINVVFTDGVWDHTYFFKRMTEHLEVEHGVKTYVYGAMSASVRNKLASEGFTLNPPNSTFAQFLRQIVDQAILAN